MNFKESETVRLCAVKCLEAIYQVLVTSTDKGYICSSIC